LTASAASFTKKQMDELIDPEASAVVMTSAQGDPAEWKQHIRDKDAEEKLLDRFRDPADPLQFVIVTSKLLTGFDAPILQVMYLDKPMKDHKPPTSHLPDETVPSVRIRHMV